MRAWLASTGNELRALPNQWAARMLLVLTASLVTLVAIRFTLLVPYQPDRWLEFGSVALLLSVGGGQLSIRTAPGPFKVVFRTTVAVFTAYLAFYSPAPLPGDSLSPMAIDANLTYGRWIAVALGCIGLFRPSFAIFTFLYAYWQKAAIQATVGLWITPLDYIAVLEVGLFLVSAFILHRILGSARLMRPVDCPRTAIHFLEAALLVGIALHFGNYFHSGLEKMWIGDSPMTWVLENRTHNLLLTTYVAGQLPISKPEILASTIYTIMDRSYVFLNAIVLVTQLGALIAIVRIRWIAWLTAIYDITHVAIFLTTGIFFWKWILLNASIVVACALLKGRVIPRLLIVFLACVVLVSPSIAYVAKLAWFDTSSVNDSYLEVVTTDGETHRVPSNYFGSLSILFASHTAGWPFGGHFATGNLGTTISPAIMRQANACQLPVAKESDAPSSSGRAILEDLVRSYHRYILSVSPDGKPLYDLFPHHMWSNPLEFAAFASLDKRHIAKYRLVVRSVCVSVAGSHIVEDLMLEGGYEIELDK